MSRRPARSGLFTGWWYDQNGKKLRRIRRDEYPELYRLHRQYLVHVVGINMFGCCAPWTLAAGGEQRGTAALNPPPSAANVYGAQFGNLHPGSA